MARCDVTQKRVWHEIRHPRYELRINHEPLRVGFIGFLRSVRTVPEVMMAAYRIIIWVITVHNVNEDSLSVNEQLTDPTRYLRSLDYYNGRGRE